MKANSRVQTFLRDLRLPREERMAAREERRAEEAMRSQRDNVAYSETARKAAVRPEEPIGGIYTATTTVVDQVLDAASNTFGVRLALPNPGLRLPAGIRCKVSFEMHSIARTSDPEAASPIK